MLQQMNIQQVIQTELLSFVIDRGPIKLTNVEKRSIQRKLSHFYKFNIDPFKSYNHFSLKDCQKQ